MSATTWLFFRVVGIPVGQGNHRQNRYGATYETTKGHAAWRKLVKESAVSAQQAPGADGTHQPWEPMCGPMAVSITFYIRRPRNHYGTGRNSTVLKQNAARLPIKGRHPDLDKAVRAVLDACTDAMCWDDDKQVVSLRVDKCWATDEPGANVIIQNLDQFAYQIHEAIPIETVATVGDRL